MASTSGTAIWWKSRRAYAREPADVDEVAMDPPPVHLGSASPLPDEG
jgi:hypothetical protein